MFEGMTFNTTSSGLEPAEPENALEPVDRNVEHAHVIEDDAAHAGEQERKKEHRGNL